MSRPTQQNFFFDSIAIEFLSNTYTHTFPFIFNCSPI